MDWCDGSCIFAGSLLVVMWIYDWTEMISKAATLTSTCEVQVRNNGVLDLSSANKVWDSK